MAFLEIKNASVGFGSYSDRYEVLEDINLSVDENEFVAIIGFSGSGKSTLMSLALRFYDPENGRILVDDQNIAEVDVASLHDEIAFVSQEVVLFNDTIRENIRFGRPNATNDEIDQAARDAMAHDFIEELPEGWEVEQRGDDDGSVKSVELGFQNEL